jgi:hypothetical protein
MHANEDANIPGSRRLFAGPERRPFGRDAFWIGPPLFGGMERACSRIGASDQRRRRTAAASPGSPYTKPMHGARHGKPDIDRSRDCS